MSYRILLTEKELMCRGPCQARGGGASCFSGRGIDSFLESFKVEARQDLLLNLECGGLLQELRDASNQDRDAQAVADVWLRAYNTTFITLFDRGLLAHLFVVDEIPEAAQPQLDAMAAEVDAYNYVEPVAEAPAPVVQIDPVTQCVTDFHEMGSNAFKVKYLTNQRNRPIYEACIDRGLL